MFDENLNVVSAEEMALSIESWEALEQCAADSGFTSKTRFLAAIANNPALLEKISLHFRAKTVDYGNLFDTPVVRPVKPVTEVLTFIHIDGDTIQARHDEKNDDWFEVVKPLDYQWNRPFWEREINEATNGTAIDRAAELGHKLLAAGFCVVFPNPEIRDIAITGTYQPEQTRWIKMVVSGKNKNHFFIRWSRGDDMYNEASKLSGARYSKPGIAVPPEHVDEVLGFADIHGFQFTESAQGLVARCQTWRESGMVVDITAIADTEPDNETDEVENIEYGIADELIDEPV